MSYQYLLITNQKQMCGYCEINMCHIHIFYTYQTGFCLVVTREVMRTTPCTLLTA